MVHHADSFGVIGGGRLDATVLGAYQVSMTGDFANWKLKGQKGGGIGGAMDLAACAKRVFIILEHVTRSGKSRLVASCDLQVTAKGVVTLVATNYGLFEPTGNGFRLLQIAPGMTVDEIRAVTHGILTVSDQLHVSESETVRRFRGTTLIICHCQRVVLLHEMAAWTGSSTSGFMALTFRGTTSNIKRLPRMAAK